MNGRILLCNHDVHFLYCNPEYQLYSLFLYKVFSRLYSITVSQAPFLSAPIPSPEALAALGLSAGTREKEAGEGSRQSWAAGHQGSKDPLCVLPCHWWGVRADGRKDQDVEGSVF